MLQFVKHCAKMAFLMADRDTCPVCRTAEIVCGKWTLLVIRDLADGRSRFCELERSLAGISPRTLSLRLRALEEEGIVERQTFPEVPPRVEYILTDKGRALVPLIESMREYGREWLGGDCAASDDPAEADGDQRAPVLVADSGREPVGAAA
jgi:DNA-binding HxlR family transcriptional regulator